MSWWEIVMTGWLFFFRQAINTVPADAKLDRYGKRLNCRWLKKLSIKERKGAVMEGISLANRRPAVLSFAEVFQRL